MAVVLGQAAPPAIVTGSKIKFLSPNRHLCDLFLLLRWPANRQTEKAAVAVSSKGGETEEYRKEASTLPIAALF
ncbi:hypothetical protein I312_106441 [Cryptococcus bacillisporus CA1280]|uniref:uncharacterized protein n=1 Tax=Cryptococcus bacillisporus CA1280 TaxID=1296109 RepID=UPI003369B032